MAFAQVQTVAFTSGTSNSLATTITAAGAGNLLVIGMGILGATETLDSVSDDKGNTYVVQAVVAGGGSNEVKLYQAYGVQVTGGATVITSHWSGSTATKRGFVDEYSGGASTNGAVFDASTTGTGTKADVSSPGSAYVLSTLTPAATGELIVACYSQDSAAVFTAASGYTMYGDVSAANGVVRSAYKLSGGASETAPSTSTHTGVVTFAGRVTAFKLAAVNPSISVSDQLNVTENVAITLINNISTSDQLNITESITMLDIQNISVSDQLNVTESVTLEINSFISVSDQINLTESVSIFLNPLLISVSDQLNITESVTMTLFQETLLLSVNDQLNITENIQTGLDNYISVNDQLTVTESVSTSLQSNISVYDQLNITENIQMGLENRISVSDQLDITESVTKTVSDIARGLVYMRGQDQNLPVTMTKQDYQLGCNDTSVS